MLREKKVPSLVDQLKRLEAEAWRALRKHEAAHKCGEECPDRWILASTACEVGERIEAARGRKALLSEIGNLDRWAFEARAKGWHIDANGKPINPRRDERAQEEFELGAVAS